MAYWSCTWCSEVATKPSTLALKEILLLAVNPSFIRGSSLLLLLPYCKGSTPICSVIEPVSSPAHVTVSLSCDIWKLSLLTLLYVQTRILTGGLAGLSSSVQLSPSHNNSDFHFHVLLPITQCAFPQLLLSSFPKT